MGFDKNRDTIADRELQSMPRVGQELPDFARRRHFGGEFQRRAFQRTAQNFQGFSPHIFRPRPDIETGHAPGTPRRAPPAVAHAGLGNKNRGFPAAIYFVGACDQSPERPPDFDSRRMSVSVISRSTALHMS